MALQVLFQLAILLVCIYAGEIIFPIDTKTKLNEWNYCIDNAILPDEKNFLLKCKTTFPSVHYTFVFNTFVFLQVFNELNARKLDSGKLSP
jgi:hypothetical protein